MKPIFSIYAGHDASITIYHPDRDKFYHLGLDRLFGIKHFNLFRQWIPGEPGARFKMENMKLYASTKTTFNKTAGEFWTEVHDIIYNEFDIENDYSLFIYKGNWNPKKPDIEDWFKTHPAAPKFERYYCAGNYRENDWVLTHHDAHAFSGLAQSPFNKAVCFTVDGGGDDTHCQITVVDQYFNILKKDVYREMFVGKYYTNLCGGRSNTFAKKTPYSIDLAGKLMGLSAYGPRNPHTNYISDKILSLCGFFYNNKSRKYHKPDIGDLNKLNRGKWDETYQMARRLHDHGCIEFHKHLYRGPNDGSAWAKKLQRQGAKFGYLSGKDELDLASSAQMAIEKYYYYMIKDVLMPDIKENDSNLILSGGCALNVLVNRMIQREFPNINLYVPRDPGDDGLSLGMLVGWMGNNIGYKKTDIEILTPKINDYNDVPDLVKEHDAVETNIDEMSTLLKEGNIIGLIQGAVERGPRALGFRSILCDPSYPDMKSIINAKVKRREGYRPFAPACREEDAEKYFLVDKLDELLRTMTSIVDVREEYRPKLSSITHIDGTARLQTVTKESNPFFYDLLTKFDGVLLNTSFNLQGKPILNTAEDGLELLHNTRLDYVVIEHNGKYWKFEK